MNNVKKVEMQVVAIHCVHLVRFLLFEVLIFTQLNIGLFVIN